MNSKPKILSTEYNPETGEVTVKRQLYSSTPTSTDYSPSNETKKSQVAVTDWEKRRPENYIATHKGEIESLLENLSERKFSYSSDTDPVTRGYMDTYREEGRLAMEDAMGKATALTGGLGNSYAQAVGNSAYNELISRGTRIIPELYEAAYNRFMDEGRETLSRIELLKELDNDEFDRYSEILSTYLDEGEMLMDNHRSISKEDFDRFIQYEKLRQSLLK